MTTPPLDTKPAGRIEVPDADPANAPPSTHQEELRSFLFFTVVMAPVLAVLLVSGYGFLVWMYQLVAGPPGG
jgi:periplasmic nitrate reductase NapE